jgi:hypothetical protein
MSQAAVDQALAIGLQCQYPMNSGHNGVRAAIQGGSNSERSLLARQYATIGKIHGMAGVGSANINAETWLFMYLSVLEAMGGSGVAAGFGTDTDGLAPGMPSLTLRGEPSLQYTSAFPASTDGSKTWNINMDGVAHYGMLWDFVEEVKLLPAGTQAVQNLMTGAEYFYQTWKLAEARSTSLPANCAEGLTTALRRLSATPPRPTPAPESLPKWMQYLADDAVRRDINYSSFAGQSCIVGPGDEGNVPRAFDCFVDKQSCEKALSVEAAPPSSFHARCETLKSVSCYAESVFNSKGVACTPNSSQCEKVRQIRAKYDMREDIHNGVGGSGVTSRISSHCETISLP